MKESKFQKDVKEFLESKGCYVVNHHGSMYSKSGTPDLLVSIDGVFHGIELKTDVGVETELQAYHMQSINDSGGLSYILRPGKHKKLKYDDEFNYWQMTYVEWRAKYFDTNAK